MHLKRLICAGAVAIGALGAAGSLAAPALATQSISGGGSTLLSPLINDDWIPAFNAAQSDYSIGQYFAVGSGTGLTNLEAGTYNYSGSDLPLSGKAGAYAAIVNGSLATGVLQVPWALTATGIAYYIPGVSDGVKLNANVLAQIYEGKITNWNSKSIQSLNTTRKVYYTYTRKKIHHKWHRIRHRHVKVVDSPKLPNLTITPVFRSDGSGDSYAFESFLNNGAGSAWTGGTPSSAWPISSVGIGEKGNAGILNEVEAVKGAIGYVAAPYLAAEITDTGVAQIENAAGNFEYPNGKNIGNAAASATSIPAQGANFGLPIMYPSAQYKIAYPISTFTYGIIPYGGSDATYSAGLQAFLTWILGTGAGYGQSFGANDLYVPLPSNVLAYDRAQLGSL